MLKIEFLDLETQNAIYRVACKYENFKVNDNDKENIMECFWHNVEKNGKCGYGLEKAITDYLLLENDFAEEHSKYSELVKDMGLEVYELEHCGDNNYY